MTNGSSYLKGAQADLRQRRSDTLREKADGDAKDLNEQIAAEDAVGEPEYHFEAGKELPAGFQNPVGGDPAHKCVRVILAPDKRRFIELYQPDWHQVFIHKTTTEQADRQFFMTEELGPVRVPTNRWVDVPKSVIRVLQDCRYEKTTIDEKAAKDALLQMAPLTIEYIPRFSFQSIPSA